MFMLEKMFGVLRITMASISWEKSCARAANIRRFRLLSCECSKDDKQSENSAKEAEGDDKSKTIGEANAKEKLNSLLKAMMKDGPLVKQSEEERITLAKPKRTKKQKPIKDFRESSSTEAIDNKLLDATKNVAESLGGNVKETESELLQKFLSTKGSTNLSELISGMSIEHGDTLKIKEERAVNMEWNQLRREQGQLGRPVRKVFEGGRQPRVPRGQPTRVDLFGGPTLGIFMGEKALPKKGQFPSLLRVWEMQRKREMVIATLHPPRNFFQQMILWTEQGKLWKFPIDNEQGMEEEKKVFFTEHVFLEPHLEPWCPKKGPVRHFMELVCVGLSKNPYLTVDEKKSHIQWYAEYFAAKKDILKEVGALPE